MQLENYQLSDINVLSRKEIVDILNDYGFACYDTESTEELRRALVVNIEDETIPFADVEMLF